MGMTEQELRKGVAKSQEQELEETEGNPNHIPCSEDPKKTHYHFEC